MQSRPAVARRGSANLLNLRLPMPDEDLKAKVAVLEDRLTKQAALEERLSKVAILDERCSNIQLELKKQREFIESLQKDTKQLQSDRTTIYAFGTVLAAFGLTGVGMAGFLIYQVIQSETRIATINGKVASTERSLNTGLQPQIEHAQITLDAYVSTKLKESLPNLAAETIAKVTGVTFLEASQMKTFVNHLNPTEDPKIRGMTNEGVVFDCQSLAPTQAKGAIINVMILGTGGQANVYASFVCADVQGHFRGDHTAENTVTNYNVNWVGAPLFCPFCEGKKQIRFRLDSNAKVADQKIACIATLIGWF
jgi:hypothetical protein